jgi:hypothetical protein
VPKYGVNPKTSEIGPIDVKNTEQYYKIIDSMKNDLKLVELDSIWKMKYSELDTGYYLSGDVLYFNENPKELILIDFYSVRAVYNPMLCKDCNVDEDILNGLSPNLNTRNKKRIVKRVNDLFK